MFGLDFHEKKCICLLFSYFCSQICSVFVMETVQEKVIDLRKVFTAKVPKLMKHMPDWAFRKIQRLLHEDEVNQILVKYKDLEGIDFVNAFLKEFNLNLVLNGTEHLNESQRIVVASNHPMGGLDGMALIGSVGKHCGKVLTPVNDFLTFLPNLRPLFIPVNKVGSDLANKKENIRVFNETFSGDSTVCYFPFGLCSRKTKGGKIMDLDWKKTFVTKSKAYQRDIVPVHVDGRNSEFFYNLARIRKFLHIKVNIEMAFLVDEMFKQRNKTMTITFGKPIPYQTFDSRFTDAEWAEKLRRFSYNLPADVNQVFDPQKEYEI